MPAAITAERPGGELWRALKLIDATKARRVHTHRTRGAVERTVAPAAPRPRTESFRLHADLTTLAKFACELAPASAVTLTA
jgi:hypothetical protein